MDAIVDRFAQMQRELVHERFADFERGVLQDNIILCDAKSGMLLAFDGAMVIFCIDTFINAHGASPDAGLLRQAANALFLAAAACFLVSCHFSLTTVIPRLRRGREDHIFWEARAFRLPVEQYVEQMEGLDTMTERREKLQHLHMLASICKIKFDHFQLAIRFGQAAFIILVLAELTRIVA